MQYKQDSYYFYLESLWLKINRTKNKNVLLEKKNILFTFSPQKKPQGFVHIFNTVLKTCVTSGTLWGESVNPNKSLNFAKYYKWRPQSLLELTPY